MIPKSPDAESRKEIYSYIADNLNIEMTKIQFNEFRKLVRKCCFITTTPEHFKNLKKEVTRMNDRLKEKNEYIKKLHEKIKILENKTDYTWKSKKEAPTSFLKSV